VAADLAERSDEVAETLAAGDECGAAAQAADLRGAVVDAINAGDVPPRLQEELTGAANDLASRIECVEPPPPPPPPATTAEEEDDEDDEDRGKGKGKAKDKKKKKEKDKGEREEDVNEDLPLETVIDTLTDELPTLPTDTTGDTTTETLPGEDG
jgi:hypothetical protein